MKKILLSLGSLLFVSAVVAGTTGAFLADSQTSTGNTFASGLVTMMYDNESYYTDNSGHLAVSTSTTWSLSQLSGKLFFNFPDVKPGDIGEDTISVHANNNDAWLCMNIKQTNSATSSAALGSNLHFVFWADDGDNVYEQGEKIFKQGTVQDLFNGVSWALADSQTNVWGTPGPVHGGSTLYIGKAWCFGDMTQTPLPQDGKGKLANSTNGPLVRGTGFTCSGVNVGNAAQGLTITADVSFSAQQSRNNSSFLCADPGSGGSGTSTTVTLFNQNFNDCSKDSNKDNDDHEYHDYSWSKSWSCHNASGDKPQCTQNLSLDCGSKDHNATVVTPSFSTLGYHTINLSYDRSTSGGATTKLVVDFSADGGSTWTTLETVTGNSPNQTKTFSLSPAADNKPSVEIRFTLTGVSSSNQATIDNVVVTGVTP